MPFTKDRASAERFNAMTKVQLKTFECLLRRMARRQGLILLKTRRRDRRAYDFGGYMIADCADDPLDHVVAGGHPHAYSLSLEEVEAFLTDDKPRKIGQSIREW